MLRWTCRICSLETATRSEPEWPVGCSSMVARRPAVGFINHHDPKIGFPNAGCVKFCSRVIFAFVCWSICSFQHLVASGYVLGEVDAHSSFVGGGVVVLQFDLGGLLGWSWVSYACFGFILLFCIVESSVVCFMAMLHAMSC